MEKTRYERTVLVGGSRDGEAVDIRINAGKPQPFLHVPRRINAAEFAALAIDDTTAWKRPEDVYEYATETGKYVFKETVHYKPR